MRRAIPLLLLAAGLLQGQAARLDLSGEWTFEGGKIFLPGSTDQAGYGKKTDGPEKGWLSRPATFEGAVHFERTILIPEPWRGQHITLFLERAHWQTMLEVDGQNLGTRNSLSTPHIYDVSQALTPGLHKLRIEVDNTYQIDVGRDAHSVGEHTQTNWNGIIGRIELRATPPVWIEDAQVYSQGRVEVTLRNNTGRPVDAELRAGNSFLKVTALEAERKVVLTLPPDPAAKKWDEYEGNLQSQEITLTAGTLSQRYQLNFGIRDFTTAAGQFCLNGRPLLLRATLECSIFPLTGYPPTSEAAWDRLYRIAREHGLNSFRFHSWCPPEAAFAAADRAGFLLYVELPVWSGKAGLDEKLDGFMRQEGFRILRTYGNHPSFIAMGLGNELRGDFKFMDNLVGEFIQADSRRLFTFSADYVRKVPGETSEFYIAQSTKGGYLRIHSDRWDKTPTGTDLDYANRLEGISVPVVAHELGQWVTYPDYREIAKYTGVLKPRNLEAFRARLEAQGMLDQAEAFQQASGRFAWQLYKEDIEAVLRTPSIGGYQLLQLQDFPGQGEALIGLLDSFWDSKGLLTPQQMNSFAGPVVPLARFSKFVWTNDEVFTAKTEVANYGKRPLAGVARWTLTDEAGQSVGNGTLPAVKAAVGELTPLMEIRAPLSALHRATRLKLTVSISGYQNDWDIWVYPKQLDTAKPPGILVTSSFDEAARAELARGGRVLLLARSAGLPMAFQPVFWSLSWFPKQPGTMGILCDPAHPALKGFPNEGRSNWQWWELTHDSKAFLLDNQPMALRPVVQVIDDYHRNHRLGAVVEATVGKGKLLAVSLDLESDPEHRPVARQLYRALLDYMSSPAFAPAVELTAVQVEQILKPSNP
ncbi:glycoside hydrolase family 2 protein [Paludibaculum fermentans]|uniref:Glycoside hydrolase family 2 n=1 Tax=Paludibaculum fermentans TaxID=1473598 RepID=A0A7S7SJ60_PALFE|nr:glycoside hydrolase family 2 [Paludibaculum fermentans]QOY86859.1 glycoside hydrolase family 2 [Paludibaculum fermentans]